MQRFRVCSLAAIVLLSVPGCNESRADVPPPVNAPIVSQEARSSSTSVSPAEAKRTSTFLYELNYELNAQGSVNQYAIGRSAVLKTIKGIKSPRALAVDGVGNIFVANGFQSNSRITEYAAGSLQLIHTATEGLHDTTGLAVDARGNVYAANFGSDTVSEYAAGSLEFVHPFSSLISGPTGIAFDSRGALYVSNLTHNAVTVYSPREKRLLRFFLRAVNGPTAIAIDAEDHIFVGNSNSTVTEYQAGSDRLIRTIAIGISPQILALATDRSGHLYVGNGNGSGGYVTEYAISTGALVRTLVMGINFPNAFAFDESNNFYVANYVGSTITVYAPGAIAPGMTISDGVESPLGIAIGH